MAQAVEASPSPKRALSHQCKHWIGGLTPHCCWGIMCVAAKGCVLLPFRVVVHSRPFQATQMSISLHISKTTKTRQCTTPEPHETRFYFRPPRSLQAASNARVKGSRLASGAIAVVVTTLLVLFVLVLFWHVLLLPSHAGNTYIYIYNMY